MQVAKGDYGYRYYFTCLDASGEKVDISDYTTIKFKYWEPGIPGTIIKQGDCTKISGPDGTLYYTIVIHDFDTVGQFRGEIELTKIGEVSSSLFFDVSVFESA
jgi:hypothetical protein